MEIKLSYDDLLIVPEMSQIESRADIDVSSVFVKGQQMTLPLLAAPMDTVCEYDMAAALGHEGAVGVIHRFMPIENEVKQVAALKIDPMSMYYLVSAAVGATGDYLERTTELVNVGVDAILIDIAHGHTQHMKNAIEAIKNRHPDVKIIAGNVATAQGARDLESWGADAIRAGIGGGSMCTTRVMTKVGYPMASMLMEIVPEVTIPVIADGGIRTPGDVAMALSLGASSVMIGSLFSGTEETPGRIQRQNNWPTSTLYKQYRGAASYEAKSSNNMKVNHIEGVSTTVEFKGPVRRIVQDIIDGLTSSMSYVGAMDIPEFQAKAKHIRISQSAYIEGTPHGLR